MDREPQNVEVVLWGMGESDPMFLIDENS